MYKKYDVFKKYNPFVSLKDINNGGNIGVKILLSKSFIFKDL